MRDRKKYSIKNFAWLSLLLATSIARAQLSCHIAKDQQAIEIRSGNKTYRFSPQFTILYNAADPGMALKPANIKQVPYNVLTWKVTDPAKADYKAAKISEATAGDGFDDKILRAKQEARTANLFHAGELTDLHAERLVQQQDTIRWIFPSHKLGRLEAYVITNINQYPQLYFRFTPLQAGWFSVGYTGAPSLPLVNAIAIWQPMIWQEKRFPDQPYLTPSYLSPLPVTMVYDGVNTIGVMGAPAEIPFDPLPVLANSGFGIALRNREGNAQSQLFAPLPGGYRSKMEAGQSFSFAAQFVVEPASITYAYERIATTLFGFGNYRKNDIASLNTALDNIADYSLSQYAWFIDSLKGCAYSTDVPGAVKNVSSLNPLELAIVMNNEEMFEKRAWPLMEFMLSREKFLFSLDSLQKIQNPSRRLKGPVAPLSELVSLYRIFGHSNSFYLDMATKEFKGSRFRNLDVKEKGENWINAMHLYKATNDRAYLQQAIAWADKYLQERVYQPSTGFTDPMAGGFFFWTSFANRWIDLLELFELTGNKHYLHAALMGARQFTMFTWMSPAIPDSMITVNKDGKAPVYWYLKSKGHKPMQYAEEQAPAWRLSETGLTPESSGTCTGHRAIFMANYAPWMLRLGYHAKDTFLMNVAKAAIIGRYRSFPGYHINTARTTAYEKFDFPLHAHADQSVSSFHYNHILPMASMLLDYLVTDAFVRSNGEINFPAEFIEGYAYLQNKFYGSRKGNIYKEKDVQLWMPAGLLKVDDVELNYIAARKGNQLFLVFTNQSGQPVSTTAHINKRWAIIKAGAAVSQWSNGSWQQQTALKDSSFQLSVPANGITTIRIQQAILQTGFQDQLLRTPATKVADYATLTPGNAHALLFRLGNYSNRLYIYLEDDDTKYKKVSLVYTDANEKRITIGDTAYPYEFTVPLDSKQSKVTFKLSLQQTDGKIQESAPVTLGK